MGKRLPFLLLFLLILLLILGTTDLLTGAVSMDGKDLLMVITGKEANPMHEQIFYQFRLPRVITAIIAGASLSASGLMMQTLFRNPLAGPYVLGISSGSALGVAMLTMGMPGVALSATVPGQLGIFLAAVAGAAAIMGLMMLVSFRVRDVLTLLVLGILVGSALSSVISILQYLSSDAALKVFVIWTMGSMGGVTLSQLKILIPAGLLGILLAFFTVKMLNALMLGEQEARTLGVNISLARLLILLSTSILTGVITGFCGPVGFVGVAVPHMARFLFRSHDHRILLPGVLLTGANVLLLSDLLTQLPGKGIVLPINSVTALVGIPVIIWVILKGSTWNEAN